MGVKNKHAKLNENSSLHKRVDAAIDLFTVFCFEAGWDAAEMTPFIAEMCGIELKRAEMTYEATSELMSGLIGRTRALDKATKHYGFS